MRVPAFSALLALSLAGGACASGVMLPDDQTVPPFGIVSQQLAVTATGQAATTTLTQVFRNPTSRTLQVQYLFPLPDGAKVDELTIWEDGKEVPAEIVPADQAEKIYLDIVRRAKDPALLERLDDKLYRLRVFPVPPGERKVRIRYSEVLPRDGGLVEYTYPLRTGAKAATLEKSFALKVDVTAEAPLGSVFSPSHEVEVSRPSEKRAVVGLEASRYVLDEDFKLLWTVEDGDVGVTVLTHRPDQAEPGTFMALIRPSRTESSRPIPRDLVFVLDTSGSMKNGKLTQAKDALKYCIDNLSGDDRFAVMEFATTVTKFKPELLDANDDNRRLASKWIDRLDAAGGTAIQQALLEAVKLRPEDGDRPFTVVFLTDGEPTIGETDEEKIANTLLDKATANTRLFTFGVGVDVNTYLLDKLADGTRAVSTYVLPEENIERKVSGFYEKYSRPALTGVRLAVGAGVEISDLYPPQLPDLFYGQQLVVLGRYTGKGKTTLSLTGELAGDSRTTEQSVKFSKESGKSDFLDGLWAQRKVGYLLDQIRLNGEKDELVETVKQLALRHGIVTPYTSYLAVPDGAYDEMERLAAAGRPLLRESARGGRASRKDAPTGGFAGGDAGGDWAEQGEGRRSGLGGRGFGGGGAAADAAKPAPAAAAPASEAAFDSSISGRSRRLVLGRDTARAGADAVQVAQQNRALRESEVTQNAMTRNAGLRTVAGQAFTFADNRWNDTRIAEKPEKLVQVKYLSQAYLQLVRNDAVAAKVLTQADRVRWLSPSGTVIEVVPDAGVETMTLDKANTLLRRS